MEIRQLKVVTQEVVMAFQKLMPQLSETITSPTFGELTEIVNSGSTLLFIATENEEIVGTLTLVRYRIPSGVKVWIEDVVVDQSMRGKGIGKMLTRFAIEYAKKNDITRIDLTSGTIRIAANEMYKKMGFMRRDTNVYRLEL